MTSWGFLTNHAQVLLCITRDPGVRLRDIAVRLGITERSAHGIVADLAEAGYMVKGVRKWGGIPVLSMTVTGSALGAASCPAPGGHERLPAGVGCGAGGPAGSGERWPGSVPPVSSRNGGYSSRISVT